MRVKPFRIGMRDLYCILSRGDNQLGEYVTASSTTIPAGAKVHHLGMSRSGMYLDVWMEHESFPDLQDYIEPEAEHADFAMKSYKVISPNMILDTMTNEELSKAHVAIQTEINHRNVQAMKEIEKEIEKDNPCSVCNSMDKVRHICEQLGVPLRVFIGEPTTKTNTSKWKIGDKVRLRDGYRGKHVCKAALMEVIDVRGDYVLCSYPKQDNHISTAYVHCHDLVEVKSDIPTAGGSWTGTEGPLNLSCGFLKIVEEAAKAKIAAQIQKVAEQRDPLPSPDAVINVEAFMRD